jgi:hypothetical protein
MAGEETTNNQSNVTQNMSVGQLGMNMDNLLAQVKKGMLTYALNANVENFDANTISYQNEEGNESCLEFPAGYQLIGSHFIPEKSKQVFFLVNAATNQSEIGYMSNNDCEYHTFLNLDCLNFNVNHPIHKAVHKITNCTTEVYWTDGYNARRYIDLDAAIPETCNDLKVQPDFEIPQLEVTDVVNGGELTAGTYQFAIQYANATGIGYTSYYSVTNPTPIANTNIETQDFNYKVNRSIVLDITNIDITGYFEYYNIAVIKTINSIQSVELVGTYFIDRDNNQITYTGQNVTQIKLGIEEIFEKYPYYDVAEDLTAVQDVLVWDNLISNDRVNYQKIANKIILQWQSYRIPATENYSDELNATDYRGYLRDEVYAFEIVFLLKNGKQTDGFHIPGRLPMDYDLVQVPNTNNDFIGEPTSYVGNTGYSPYWKIYNTGAVIDESPGYNSSASYKGPYQFGIFSYWESDEDYPPDVNVWGDLAGQKIRHHKFPDVLVSPIFESRTPTIVYDDNLVPSYSLQLYRSEPIYPIGVRLDVAQVQEVIAQAIINEDITQAQADEIQGFKIVRGNRSTNRSIIGKGIIRNVGKYEREGTTYYFPNYPYNDLTQDPFLLEQNNAFSSASTYWKIVTTVNASIQYTDTYTNTSKTISTVVGTQYICSITEPVVFTGTATISSPVDDYNAVFYVITSNSSTQIRYQDAVNYPANTVITVVRGTPAYICSATGPQFVGGDTRFIIAITDERNPYCYPNNLNAFSTDESKYRMVFNSPETSFGSPTLGSVLKLENVMFGVGNAHFVQVKNNAMYKLVTKQVQAQALRTSYILGLKFDPFDSTAMFTAYQAYLQVYINGISRGNFANSFNSIGSYDYWAKIANGLGIKQRELDKYQYLFSGFQSVGDLYDINNFQREDSVYLKTADGKTPLLYAKDTPSLIFNNPDPFNLVIDNSRFTISQKVNCGNPEKVENTNLVAYYASLKNIMINQWGQMYTYETIDTGFQVMLNDVNSTNSVRTIFGGDTFINKFAFKIKLPFFIDNRVGAPDDSDVFYDEIGNVAYPQYWHSGRSVLYDYQPDPVDPVIPDLKGIVSIKAHNFDCSNQYTIYTPTPPSDDPQTRTLQLSRGNSSYSGKMYLFAYGIPYYYVESSINVDLRQAFNNLEGEFYPHVSSGIPDDWLQQTRVPIALNNTYFYNVSYSKQNVDNYFSHLPENWDENNCNIYYPFRAIYSDQQSANPGNKVNNWLSYAPLAYFDFPQNYGKLVSLDGIDNKAILARFENKSLLYNTMLTINTSNPQAAYLGNETLFKSAPPVDFAETDLGYVGSQHKILLKIPEGQVTIDAKRGQIFLLALDVYGRRKPTDLTAFGSGVNRFMTDHLAFEILRYFPEADVDNHFTKAGLHAVYDSKYDRIIISKLDYIPQPSWIGKIYYNTTTKEYFIYPIQGNTEVTEIVQLTNINYFCNKSWTLSFDINTKSWISFHSYIPNYYIAENNFFYSGLNGSCDLSAIAAREITPTTTSTTTTVALDCDLVGLATKLT